MYTKSDLRRILQQRQKRQLPSTGLTPAAVLIPLYEKSGEHHVVFTKRTDQVEKHKGQPCFPGGTRHPE